MTKLSNLMQFQKPLTQLLLSLPSGSWNRSTPHNSTLPPLNLDVDSRAILARWTMDVIDTLVAILENKSKSLLRPKSTLAASLFILNNLSEIEKRVRADRSLQSVIGSIGTAEREKDPSKRGSRGSNGSNSSVITFSMPKSFEKAKRAGLDGISLFVWLMVGYLDGYKDAAGHLLDVTYIKGPSNRSSGSLSGKEREAVKERFRVFLLISQLI
jgi:Exo70 exocyst complex subunit